MNYEKFKTLIINKGSTLLTDYQSIISMKKVQERFTSKSYPATWLLGYQTVSEAI